MRLTADLRYGVRQWVRHPALGLVIVLSLILGIGANGALATLFNAVFYRPLPVKEPNNLVLLGWTAQTWPTGITVSGYSEPDKQGRDVVLSFPYSMYERLLGEKGALSDVIAFAHLGKLRVSQSERTSLAEGDAVSSNYFSMLGVNPVLGTTFSSLDTSAALEPEAVISYRYWQQAFNGDRSVVGRSVYLNNVPVRIIGIAPGSFSGVEPGRRPDFWLPLTNRPQLTPWGARTFPNASVSGSNNWYCLMIIARLPSGSSVQQAQAAISRALTSELHAGAGSAHLSDGITVQLLPAARGLGLLRDQFAKPLWILAGAVGLLLLLACLNISMLLLARGDARLAETAVRFAIGASRAQLIRQVLTENLLISVPGGLLALLLCSSIARGLLWWAEADSISLDLHLDWGVIAFTAG